MDKLILSEKLRDLYKSLCMFYHGTHVAQMIPRKYACETHKKIDANVRHLIGLVLSIYPDNEYEFYRGILVKLMRGEILCVEKNPDQQVFLDYVLGHIGVKQFLRTSSIQEVSAVSVPTHEFCRPAPLTKPFKKMHFEGYRPEFDTRPQYYLIFHLDEDSASDSEQDSDKEEEFIVPTEKNAPKVFTFSEDECPTSSPTTPSPTEEPLSL